MKNLVYSPQPKASTDELMQVLKVFTYSTLPTELKTGDVLFKLYDELTPEAKRHFKVIDENN